MLICNIEMHRSLKSLLIYRTSEVETSDWLNVTILHVSYEDNGRYFCGVDMKELAVINAG